MLTNLIITFRFNGNAVMNRFFTANKLQLVSTADLRRHTWFFVDSRKVRKIQEKRACVLVKVP